MIDTRIASHTESALIQVLLQEATQPSTDSHLAFGWSKPVYLQFRSLALHSGLTVDLSRTYFCGFYQEGSGCSYAAEIDVKRLLTGLKQTNGQAHQNILVQELLVDPDVIGQLQYGLIRAHGHVRPLKQHTRIYVALDFWYPTRMANYWSVDGEIEGFIDAVTDLCEQLNQWLFARLMHTYECLVGGAAPVGINNGEDAVCRPV